MTAIAETLCGRVEIEPFLAAHVTGMATTKAG
jgi:hypothetical protein